MSEAPQITPARREWDRCRPWLEAALEGGPHTLAQVEQAVISGEAMFWPGREAAMVTRLADFPNQRMIHVWLAGGALSELLAMAPGIEAWARLNGCAAVLIEGRKGWERALKAEGYAFWSVTMKKEL